MVSFTHHASEKTEKELAKFNITKETILQTINKPDQILYDTQTERYIALNINKKIAIVYEKTREDQLIITNLGNTKYTKIIEIVIGDTTGEKKLDLDVNEEISYRLITPEGNYNIKIINDEGETIFTKNSVTLRGRGLTGEAIGVLDEKLSGRSGLTGGISPDEESDDAIAHYLKNSSFVYVFVLVIFGATILLAIERRYRKKAS